MLQVSTTFKNKKQNKKIRIFASKVLVWCKCKIMTYMHTYDVKYFSKYRNNELLFNVGLSIFRNLYKIKLTENMYEHYF